MQVFISSVRRGLENERRSLGALIDALGHTPLKFEDFGASDAPSRAACLAGVKAADVYLLILGPRYGEAMPETGQSPTQEEWEEAKRRGIPRLVYRKLGVEFEPNQQAFYREIAQYNSGVFHDSFTEVADLQIKIARRLKDLSETPGPLQYKPLPSAGPSITWRTDFFDGRKFGPGESTSILEVHVAIPDFARSERELRLLGESLAGRIRRSRLVSDDGALKVERHLQAYIVLFPATQTHWDTPREGAIGGIRLAPNGQVSAWATLPSNGIGSLFDREMLPFQIRDLLVAIGSLELVQAGFIAVACAISPIQMMTMGRFGQNERSATFPFTTRENSVRVNPDELISIAALSVGAEQVGRDLTAALLDQLTA